MIYNVKFDLYFFINLNYKISREIPRNFKIYIKSLKIKQDTN
jgi:hypothetical protein